MLLTKKEILTVGEVAAIKLVSGDEVIGRVTEITDKSISLTKPVILQMHMVSANDAQLGFAPLMAGAPEDGTFQFDYAQCLIRPLKARKDVAGGYLQATTGLATPQTGLIV